MGHSLGESLRAGAYIHRYCVHSEQGSCAQRQTSIISLLLPECATLERVSASFLSLYLSYSLYVASLSASTVIPSTIV